MNKWIILAPILAWYLWRNVGRQQLRTGRLLYSFVVFGGGTVAVAALYLTRPILALGWGGGLILGVALGLIALHLTRFESTAEGQFYTPNAHIGILLVVIFVGRMAYRFSVLGGTLHPFTGGTPPPFGDSALTLLSFEGVAGYYLAYYIGVFRRFRSLAAAVPPA